MDNKRICSQMARRSLGQNNSGCPSKEKNDVLEDFRGYLTKKGKTQLLTQTY
jgi:hypothetical protein